MFDKLWKNEEDKTYDDILNKVEHVSYTPGDVILINYKWYGATDRIAERCNSLAIDLGKALEAKVYISPITNMSDGDQGITQIIVFNRGSFPKKLKTPSKKLEKAG